MTLANAGYLEPVPVIHPFMLILGALTDGYTLSNTDPISRWTARASASPRRLRRDTALLSYSPDTDQDFCYRQVRRRFRPTTTTTCSRIVARRPNRTENQRARGRRSYIRFGRRSGFCRPEHYQ